MTGYFLGVDIGSSKSHACIADGSGTVVGFGAARGGNHESAGYPGLVRALGEATDAALSDAGISKDALAGAGFGIAGFDWETERAAMLDAVDTLGIRAPLDIVNDAMLGVIGGCAEGWGIALVAGTGCNCRGRSRDRTREGMVTGAGQWMGEGAGASELMQWTIQSLAHMWTRRGPFTQLAGAMVERAGARDLGDLLEGIINHRYAVGASAAPLVFEIAAHGDAVAQGLVERAGRELGELANAVIRQLELQGQEFDVVLVGSMFNAGESLLVPLRETVLPLAPGARFVRPEGPPVLGAVLLAMEQAGLVASAAVRERLTGTLTTVQGAHARA
jgi:N-acetylglucosamine kinase-like BadF-type ATPase